MGHDGSRYCGQCTWHLGFHNQLYGWGCVWGSDGEDVISSLSLSSFAPYDPLWEFSRRSKGDPGLLSRPVRQLLDVVVGGWWHEFNALGYSDPTKLPRTEMINLTRPAQHS